MPLGIKSLSITAEHDNHMNGEQLDVVVQMASYMSFDMIEIKGGWHTVLAY